MKFPRFLATLLLLTLIVEEGHCAWKNSNSANAKPKEKSRGCSFWPWNKKTQTAGSKPPTQDPKECTTQQGGKPQPQAHAPPSAAKPAPATKPHPQPAAKPPVKPAAAHPPAAKPHPASPQRPVSPAKPALQRTGSGSWVQPRKGDDFKHNLNQKLVLIENMNVNGGKVTGSIEVKNIDFQKTVKLRYSLDNWKTHADVLATHGRTTGQTDHFTVNFTPDPKKAVAGAKLQFAAMYKVKGQEHWDNNNNQNYFITLK